jgi:4-hydroxy-tetrahydrodipicolinate synthase
VTRSELATGGRRLPILLGLSGASTAKMLAMLDETAGWPIDGYLIASPYYIRPSQRGILQHFTALADRAARPIVLYNIPYRTAVNITNETLLQLAAHPNIVGMKDCSADRAQSIDFLSRRPSGFRVLTGEDAQYHEGLSDGADGAILLSAHLETEAFASVRTRLMQGDREGALACWKQISGLTRVLFAEPSPAPAKYCLAQIGLIDSAEVRLPMVEVSAELAALLDEASVTARRCGGWPERIGRMACSRSRRAGAIALAEEQPIGHDRREAEQHRPDSEGRHQKDVVHALGVAGERKFLAINGQRNPPEFSSEGNPCA